LEFATLPPNQNVVCHKWTFKVKFSNGTIAKYKTELVAKGIFNNKKTLIIQKHFLQL
jgi:hypothetical protein